MNKAKSPIRLSHLTVACLLQLGIILSSNWAAAAEQQPDQKAPVWQLKDVSGKTVKSTDFTGKVVILDFWATWCPPCVQEIPGFIELQKKYGNNGLVVVGVSVDDLAPEKVKKFTEKRKVNYPVVMYSGKIIRDFGGVAALPTTFVIDTKGRIVNKHVGFVSLKAFEKEIKPLLPKKQNQAPAHAL